MKRQVFVLITVFLLIPGSVFCSQPFVTVNLTDNDFLDSSPKVSDNGRVVWSVNDDVDSPTIGLMLFDGFETVRLSNNSESFDINQHGLAVWNEVGESGTGIFVNDEAGTALLCRVSHNAHGVRINNQGMAVWSGYDGSFFGVPPADIFLFDGTGVRRITDDGGCHFFPEISDTGDIVWRSNLSPWRYLYYNGTETTEIGMAADISLCSMNASGQVVYSASDGHDKELFLYDDGVHVQLTYNDVDDRRAVINEAGQMAWLVSQASESETEVVLYDGVTVKQVTDNSVNEHSLGINNAGHVVWVASDGEDDEIYFYNGVKVIQVTDNNFDDMNPQLNNADYIVWAGGDYIYNGLPMPEDLPVNIEIYAAVPLFQEIDSLVAMVSGLGTGTAIKKRLLSMLDKTRTLIMDENEDAAVQEAERFIDTVFKIVAQGKLSEEEGQGLIESVDQLIKGIRWVEAGAQAQG